MKFYKCSHCGNIVAYVQDNGPKAICCGEEMTELVPKTADSAVEKHVPVVEALAEPMPRFLSAPPKPLCS